MTSKNYCGNLLWQSSLLAPMKRRDSWHSQILFCASLNTLLVAITVAMVIVARIYIGKCHDVCAFAGSNLHKLTGNVKSVLYAGEVEEYIDEFILVDNSTNLVCMLTQSIVSLDALLRLESVQSGKYKQRLFCFAHESLSTDALSVILSKLSAVLRRTEIYCAGVGNISCKSLYAAILGDCPLGEKCIDQRMLCVPLEDWTGGTGEIVRLRYVWPKRYPVEFLENTSDEVESAVYETTDETGKIEGKKRGYGVRHGYHSKLPQVRQAKLGRTDSGRSCIVKKSTYD